MSSLVVVGFPSMAEADQVRRQLVEIQKEELIALEDAVVVEAEPDGKVRQDMPGGWPGDERDAFSETGRTPEEQAWYNLLHGLLSIRRDFPKAFQGDMEHFFPVVDLFLLVQKNEQMMFQQDYLKMNSL